MISHLLYFPKECVGGNLKPAKGRNDNEDGRKRQFEEVVRDPPILSL